MKNSGHTRLKAALVLRDALTAELGLFLPAAMRQLANVEDTLGARAALEEGRYLEALASLGRGDPARLALLDDRLRVACAKAQLAPRYAQYLALLLFAHWQEARASDPAAFLNRLNDQLIILRLVKNCGNASSRSRFVSFFRVTENRPCHKPPPAPDHSR